MNFEKSLQKFFSQDASPVRPNEVICLTRVIWMPRKSGFHSTRTFPTAERAWAFAALQDRVVAVQPVADPIPEQRRSVNKEFAKGKRRKTR